MTGKLSRVFPYESEVVECMQMRRKDSFIYTKARAHVHAGTCPVTYNQRKNREFRHDIFMETYSFEGNRWKTVMWTKFDG